MIETCFYIEFDFPYKYSFAMVAYFYRGTLEDEDGYFLLSLN